MHPATADSAFACTLLRNPIHVFAKSAPNKLRQLALGDATEACQQRISQTVKGQHRTLCVSDVLDHVIAVSHVGGGDLRKLLSDSACRRKRSFRQDLAGFRELTTKVGRTCPRFLHQRRSSVVANQWSVVSRAPMWRTTGSCRVRQYHDREPIDARTKQGRFVATRTPLCENVKGESDVSQLGAASSCRCLTRSVHDGLAVAFLNQVAGEDGDAFGGS